MADTFEVTQNDLDLAAIGVKAQAEAHGLDMEDPRIKAFLEHLVKVDAANDVWIRMLQNILNEHTLPKAPEPRVAILGA